MFVCLILKGLKNENISATWPIYQSFYLSFSVKSLTTPTHVVTQWTEKEQPFTILSGSTIPPFYTDNNYLSHK